MEVGDRVGGAGIDDGGAVLVGQERRVPIFYAVRRHSAVVGQHDEGGKVLVDRTEAVADPAASARKSRQQETRRLQQSGLRMDARLAGDIVDEGDVVNMRTEFGDGFTEHFSAVAVRLEVPHRLEPRAEAVLKGFDRLAECAWFTVIFDEVGLEVKEIEMAGRARHEELDDALGLGREGERGRRGARIEHTKRIAREHRRQRDSAESAARVREKVSARLHTLCVGAMEG